VKRSAALASLSRDHHQALFVAQRLRRSTEATAGEAREAFLAYWTTRGRRHFRLEEELLLPSYAAYGDSHHPLVLSVLGDHVAIRQRADRLAGAPLRSSSAALRGQLTIAASDEGTLDALRFAGELDQERVWAVEDCRHVSGRLERGLLASGDRVVRVAPGLTETSRRTVREAGKSDPIDATAIARAAIREGLDSLPAAFLDERALEIRVLNDYRDQIITERIRLASRLRWHLVQTAPELEAQIRPAGLIGPRVRANLARKLARLPHSPQLRVAKAILKRICDIYREEGALLAELKALIEAHCPQLLAEHGCGTVTAAIIIGHTTAAKQFPTDACFAHHAGTAPIAASSGNTKRHRRHRGGDRQLNRAIHIIALSRARTDPTTRAYLDRRHSEGKTKREAIRCLKRHLARRIWRLLYTTQTPAPPRVMITRSNPEIPNFT
jgi:transposase